MEASFPLRLLLNPGGSVVHLDDESVSRLIEAAGDVVVIIDRDGVVLNATIHDPDLARETQAMEFWAGRHFADCVDPASRHKVDPLLRDALEGRPARWVHVNHDSPRGSDIPVLYAAVRIGGDHLLAMGRDLRATSRLQQRLVNAQQTMERDYVRLRQAETRYRLLFLMSPEPVLVVDAATQKTVEANPASWEFLGYEPKQASRAAFLDIFDRQSRPAAEALLAQLRGGAHPDPIAVRLAGDDREILLSASLFTEEAATLFLVRLRLAGNLVEPALPPTRMALLKAVDSAPDGFVLTDPHGRILAANASFRDLAQLASEDRARASSFDEWLGRPGVDMNVMIATLRQRGSVSLFATTLCGEHGSRAEVEISGVTVSQGRETYYAFVIRNVGRRLPADFRIGREVPRSVDQLTELIGRVPLKDLVREATDMIERLCIMAALEMTGDNRASAAEMLGLSRQSLYVKLRRHGLGELDGP